LDVEELKGRMGRVGEHLREELGRLRDGAVRANMLDSLEVEAYGGERQSLQSLATTAVEEGGVLVVTVFDPATAGSVRKAVEGSGQGLHVVPDGGGKAGVVRVKVPKMTREAREALAKQAGQLAEDAKQHLRRLRHKALQELARTTSHGTKKPGGRRKTTAPAEDDGDDGGDGGGGGGESGSGSSSRGGEEKEEVRMLSEDEAARIEKQIEDLTKEAVRGIDAVADAKKAKILADA
jgi:ribosome recycling factor